MTLREMDNMTFLRVYAEQKDKVKKENRLLYEMEEELKRRLDEGELNYGNK